MKWKLEIKKGLKKLSWPDQMKGPKWSFGIGTESPEAGRKDCRTPCGIRLLPGLRAVLAMWMLLWKGSCSQLISQQAACPYTWYLLDCSEKKNSTQYLLRAAISV